MKTLGLDLGTNSIGWSIRNTDNIANNDSQIEKFGVTIFEKGVGEGKTGEFSFAAQRTKKRASRRLYQARKYRLWKTLEIMIELGFCPMTIENLNRWRKYDKKKAHNGESGRAYPVNDILFDSWIKLDFDGDGKPDYTSPYQLRAQLLEKKLDLSIESDRYKIGRALYHIAQRRGFKSSRKDAIPDDSGERQDTKSEIKKETEFEKNLQKNFGKSLIDFPTIGSALAFIERQGYRIRLEWIQNTFRKHYKDECTIIFEFQGIGLGSELYTKLIESRKNHYNGSIFKQRPLRSQKGLVGTCTLESKVFKDPKLGKITILGKPRCPISHPEFEEFRALSFLNNVQYRIENGWFSLSWEQKTEIYNRLFFRSSKPHFLFSEIRKMIEKQIGKQLDYVNRTINYSDKTNVSGCPLSACLKDIFGENWYAIKIETNLSRKTRNEKEHLISYSVDDIWHVLFSFDNEDLVSEFAENKLGLDEQRVKKFVKAWKTCKEGYSMLSLYAIKKINRFLREGFIYTEAVLLANIPQIIGDELWKNVENQNLIKQSIAGLIKKNREEKKILAIVNNLIAEYKSLRVNEKYGYKDPDYILNDSEKDDIIDKIVETYGKSTWSLKTDNKSAITETVIFLFQCAFQNGFPIKYFGEERYHVIDKDGQLFHKSASNQFYKLLRLVDTIKDFLRENFPSITEMQLSKLYHPSMIEIYPSSYPDQQDGKIYLQSPKTGAFKNPMAMRTLYELRKLINYLIKTGQIDEETRIVIETARELNDANKRWAIDEYQRKKQSENHEFAEAIRGLIENKELENPPHPENVEATDKVRLWYEQTTQKQVVKGTGEYSRSIWSNQSTTLFTNLSLLKTAIDKYRLWKEQKCTCIYTGKIISISDLFDENKTDFEHTIPRSISFDNSLANQTVCYANYNRNIKKNQLPTSLPNYAVDALGFPAILPRLKEWEDKVEHLKSMVEFWKGRSKSDSNSKMISSTSSVSEKDFAIRQRHLWQMDLDYWRNKLERFTMTDVTSGFKNSQLVDTQLISKYALHYLRTAFNTVEVQKGTVTAVFRKVLGVQSVDEKKRRDKHSHHAIDATILTLIPYPAKREKILKYFFELDEIKKLHDERNQKDRLLWLETELTKEIGDLSLPNTNLILKSIEDQILINNIARDKSLVIGKKYVRRRGRIVYLRDKEGNLLFNSNGEQKLKIAQGDCIRGELHKDTFLGAIRQPKLDETGKWLKDEDGKVILEPDLIFVVREPLCFKKDASSSGFKSLNEIRSCIVDQNLYKIIETQSNEKGFREACTEGFWMLNKRGEKVNKIRHIRIYVRNKSPLHIKKHTNLSHKELTILENRDHKKNYYAANAENVLYGYYWNGKSKNRSFICLNLFQVASIRNTIHPKKLKDYFEPFKELGRGKIKKTIPLYEVLRPGIKVLFYKDNREELLELDESSRLKRLYRVTRLFSALTGQIMFEFHKEARTDDELMKEYPEETFGKRGKNGFSEFNFEIPCPRLLMSPVSFDFIIEGRDFKVQPDGKIIFIS